MSYVNFLKTLVHFSIFCYQTDGKDKLSLINSMRGRSPTNNTKKYIK